MKPRLPYSFWLFIVPLLPVIIAGVVACVAGVVMNLLLIRWAVSP